MDVAYYGMPGSYTHQAANQLDLEDKNLISCRTFRETFDMLESGRVAMAVVPAENSTTGAISDVCRLLYEREVSITSELLLRIEHCLAAKPGTRIEDIEAVYSHPQGLEQTAVFLAKHPQWEKVPFFDTAASAAEVAMSDKNNKAAITSEYAAAVYGLQVLERRIADNDNNATRFVVLEKGMDKCGANADKTSLIAVVDHKPGSLYAMLKAFAGFGVNMLRLDSHPIPGKPWEYMFFVDIEGTIASDNIRSAVKAASENASHMRMLGSYVSQALDRES